MALLRVLAFDHEGKPVQFDTWLDDLQLYLLSDSKDSWLTRDAAARLAIRNHLPLAECAHFGQHKTAQALYAAVVARYSSPATVALGCLLLFPKLSTFATLEDLVSHLRTSAARYRATVPAEDHFLSLDPTSLTVHLLEQHHLAAETSAVAVGAARGTPRPPFFEGCSPSPLAPFYASAAAADISVAEDVGAASASAKRRSSKGTGGRGGGGGSSGGGGGSGSGGGGSSGGSEGSGSGGGGGTGGGSGGAGGGGGGSGGSGGSGGGGTGGGRTRPRHGGPGGGQQQQQQRRSETYAEGECYRCVLPDPGIAAAALGASDSGTLPGTAPAQALHTFTLDSGASRCFFRDNTTLTPLPAPVPVRLADPFGGPVVARSSTVLPCPAVLSGSLSGLHLPSFSMILVSTAALQDAMVTTTTPGGQRVSICTCTRTGRHLATFTRRPGSSLYTLVTKPPQVAASTQSISSSASGSATTFLSCVCTLTEVQNGIAECRIGLVTEVARTSMIHAATPHFLWSFAVRYAAHQLNLWPRVSLPETSPTLRWTGEVGNASVFRVWGSRAFVCDTSADKLSTRAIPCVFLGFVPDAPGWQFYHPTSRRVLPSQDVTFDESVPFYRLFPYSSAHPPPPPLFLAPGPPPVDPLLPQGPAPSGVSQVYPLPSTAPIEVAVGSGAAPGAASRGAASRGAEPRGAGCEGAGSAGAEPEGVEPGGAESEGAESGGAETRGAALSGGPAGASPMLSPQQLCEWLVRHARLRSGAPGVGGAGDAGAGGAGVTAGAGGTGGTVAAGPGGARTRGAGAAGTGGVGGARAGDPTKPGAAGAGGSCAGGAGAGGAGAEGARVGGTSARGAGAAGAGTVDPGAGGAGGTVRPRLYFVPLLQQVLRVPSFTGLTPPLLCPPPDQSPLPLQPASPLPAPSPYTGQSGGLTERHEPAPTVSRLLTTAVTDPSFESAAASALIAELLDFAAACRLEYATALVAESASTSPPSVGGECALGTDVLEDKQEDFECLAAAIPRFASMLLAREGDPDAPDIPTPRSYAEAITDPYSSQWQAAMDAKMASWKSKCTYVDAVPLPGANIVDGMWIFRVKRLPGSPPAFKARYVARGFTFLQGSLHEEIWLRRPPGFTESFPTGTQWSLRRTGYGLRQAPCEWHDTVRTTLAALGFAPATADPSLFLRTNTTLPPFYVLVYVDDLVFATADTEALTLVKSELQKRHTCTDLGELRSYLGLQITRDRARRTIALTYGHMVHQVLQRFGFQFSLPQPTPLSTSHSLSAPPLDESVEPSGPYPELVGCLMYLMTCRRPDLAYPLSLLARYKAPGRHRKLHWDATKRVPRYLCSTSGMGLLLGGRGLVVLTSHADASWVDDLATQRSSQGYTFSLGSGSVS
ncbi:unnamed protein product [Closterium sp. NIES-54]